MAWRYVRQPNGRIAVFSDIVDNFTHYNLDDFAEPLAVWREKGGCCDCSHFRQKLARADDTGRWQESAKTVEQIHGKKAREAAEREGARPIR